MKKYQIIYADPPWKFKVWCFGTGSGRSPDQYYPTMELEDICALPVKNIAAKNCILFLWGTWPKLEEALQVIYAWGFKYKTSGFVWVKQNPSGEGIMCGLGYWTRKATEFVLLATKGSPKRINEAVMEVLFAPRGRHSSKPSEIRNRIVDLMGDLPRIELFARKEEYLFDKDGFDGWDVWGNEVESDIDLLAQNP